MQFSNDEQNKFKHSAKKPTMSSKTYFSKCGKYFIHQTTITSILPMPYLVKIIDSQLESSANQQIIENQNIEF